MWLGQEKGPAPRKALRPCSSGLQVQPGPPCHCPQAQPPPPPMAPSKALLLPPALLGLASQSTPTPQLDRLVPPGPSLQGVPLPLPGVRRPAAWAGTTAILIPVCPRGQGPPAPTPHHVPSVLIQGCGDPVRPTARARNPTCPSKSEGLRDLPGPPPACPPGRK